MSAKMTKQDDMLAMATPTAADGPLVSGGGHLVINVSYDSSVTSLAASNPTLYAEYTAAAQTAVQFYENEITNPITVNIGFGWGEVGGSSIDPGADGESSSYVYSTNYATLYNAVVKTDTTSAAQAAAVAALPTTDPTGGATFTITTAEAKALGLNVSGYTIGGSIGLDSSSASVWSWSQTNVAANTEDAVGVLDHEISEVLGRSDNGGQDNSYSLLDMFRYTAADGGAADAPGSAVGARDQPFAAGYSTTAPASASPGVNSYSYFSYNGKTVTLAYETPDDVAQGADIADWSPSVPNDSYADSGYDGADIVSTTDLQEMNVLGYDLACFAAATRLVTTRGPIPVESLREGDLVVTVDGTPREIIWIGQRRVNCRRHPRPRAVWPVRIRAGAFAPGVPARDVVLSPDHAVFVRNVLIPIRYLVNGASIHQEEVDELTYYHVELPSHAVLLSEGLPVESYLDTGNRGAFTGGGASPRPHPDFAPRVWREQACAALVVAGAACVAARRTLLDRAAALGFSATNDPALHVVANGQVLRSEIRGRTWRFEVPRGTKTLRLMSRHMAPAHIHADRDDHRRLGVAIGRITLDDATVPLHDRRLGTGWHAPEHQWRWTDGTAEIFVDGAATIAIDVVMAGPYWMPMPAHQIAEAA